jgi:hypothetical protein
MALAKDEKVDVIKKFAREKGDTGSPEVQIALLSVQIDILVVYGILIRQQFVMDLNGDSTNTFASRYRK